MITNIVAPLLKQQYSIPQIYMKMIVVILQAVQYSVCLLEEDWCQEVVRDSNVSEGLEVAG